MTTRIVTRAEWVNTLQYVTVSDVFLASGVGPQGDKNVIEDLVITLPVNLELSLVA